MEFTRESILANLRAKITARQPIVAAGCSAGLIAKAAEAGGADLIVVYSTGRSRIMGLPTTILGDSNAITMQMYDELHNVVDKTPIIGGAWAGDPTYRRTERLVRSFVDTGYDGLINFPTEAINPERAKMREHVGQGLGVEAEMMRIAREMNVFTMAYALTIEQGRILAAAGADVVVPHAGWTTGGMIGRSDDDTSLARSVEHVQEIIDAAAAENPDVICLAHGGAIATPEDTEYLYANSDAKGFVGASSVERIPIERAIIDTVKSFAGYNTR
ncbi:phosphoenolpyruvate hydrolase family protein [Microbacterium esteraromaticum]|uniref:Phosphoenolpyruvate hydrolase family protein n=1 Tax=Microbacterium esteraromaticum TaxID=57043 RepID=A0A7D7WHD4_9MICO|nr:phosphoenolpyruvate hydrolase family protein [Microbacterium esteraromaticum]